MNIEDELANEKRWKKRARMLEDATDTGLTAAVARMGGTLQGLSARLHPDDCLVTLRADFPAGPMVCFIGGDSLASCLLKACREGRCDQLRWKPDKYKRR